MKKSWLFLVGKAALCGLLLGSVLFFGWSSQASASSGTEVFDTDIDKDSVLCQYGGGGKVSYFVLRPDAVSNLNDICTIAVNDVNDETSVFREVARCGDGDLIWDICDSYGFALTRNHLPKFDGDADLPDWEDGPWYHNKLDSRMCIFSYINKVENEHEDEYFKFDKLKIRDKDENCAPIEIEYETN